MSYSREITSLDEIKSIRLNILLSFHQFCIANNINYSITYGTLIGALRHKGFIPWDDDVDVCMLRKDYEKFEDLFPSQYGKLVYYTLKRNRKWNRPYGKLFDNSTVEIENNAINIGIGVSIDVFPIDEVPDKKENYFVYNKIRVFLIDVMMLKSLIWSSQRNFSKNLSVFISKILLYPFPFRGLAKLIDKYGQLYNNRGNERLMHNCDSVDGNYFMNKRLFDEYIDVEFEGYQLRAMRGYDNYLHAIYGDYMQLPSEDKRESHHSFNAYRK